MNDENVTTTTSETSAPTTSETSKSKRRAATSKKSAKKAPALKAPAGGAGRDALGGRIGARTHAIHRVLYAAGAPLSTNDITARASKLLGAPCNATSSHLNTMRLREYLERKNGAWALTNVARKLMGGAKKKGAKAPKNDDDAGADDASE